MNPRFMTARWQLDACAAQSKMGNALVIAAPCVVLGIGDAGQPKCLLGREFFGHNVRFGDNWLLITYALSGGRAVQQTTACN